MATFDSAERSQRLSRPIVLYTITTYSAVYRLTTHGTDVTFGSFTFSALPVIHDDEQITQDAAGDEIAVHLPISHPFVQRFAATGIPEQGASVLVQTLQSVAGVAVQSWSGPAQAMTISGHMAAFRVPRPHVDAVRIQLPTVGAQKQCQHDLFDGRCAPHPGGDWPADGSGNAAGGPVDVLFFVVAQVAAVSADGLQITLVSDGGQPDGWFRFGKILSLGTVTRPGARIPSGEVRGISDHVGNVLTLSVPFVGSLADLQTVDFRLSPGCDKQMSTCVSKFANRANFGGHPYMDGAINPWVPAGFGVIQQV